MIINKNDFRVPEDKKFVVNKCFAYSFSATLKILLLETITAYSKAIAEKTRGKKILIKISKRVSRFTTTENISTGELHPINRGCLEIYNVLEQYDRNFFSAFKLLDLDSIKDELRATANTFFDGIEFGNVIISDCKDENDFLLITFLALDISKPFIDDNKYNTYTIMTVSLKPQELFSENEKLENLYNVEINDKCIYMEGSYPLTIDAIKGFSNSNRFRLEFSDRFAIDDAGNIVN